MSPPPSILLWGDEILDPVRRLLRRTHVGANDLSSRATAEDIDTHYDLVVMSLAQALELDEAKSSGGSDLPGSPVRVVVHSQDFLPLRDRLRGVGVDFLVQTSVDPEVLRLLFLHALYRGPEKRSSPRLLVGSRLTYSTAEATWPATLIDLNKDGCRLLCHTHVPAPETPVTVALPADLAGGESLALVGHSLRAEATAKSAMDGQFAVAFGSLGVLRAQRLGDLLAGKSIGTLVTHLADGSATASRTNPAMIAETPGPARQPAPSDPPIGCVGEAAGGDGRAERRQNPRVPYTNIVTVLTGDESRVLLGRDLSRAGVRVEPDAELAVGSALEVAIYGGARTEPVLVPAVVTRDDGEGGLLLGFDQEAVPTLRDLEQILRTCGVLGSLTRFEAGDGPVIVSGDNSPAPAR